MTRGKVKLEEQAAKSEIIKIPRDGREWSHRCHRSAERSTATTVRPQT